ncbi:MAG: class I SAM-dependent methyltransferase [Fibrobacteria bacterium]|nr:class I SAM-dependent methyltransferase [Fibrobacteria bacterium]
MNTKITLGIYFTYNEFFEKYEAITKIYYSSFSNLDPVSLTFFLMTENENEKSLTIYGDAINQVIHKDFFFLKTLPDIGVTVFSDLNNSQVDGVINSNTYRQNEIFQQSKAPLMEPNSQALLNFVFDKTSHVEDFFAEDFGETNIDSHEISQETKQVDVYWGELQSNKSVNDIYFAYDHNKLGCTLPEYIFEISKLLPSVDNIVSLGCGKGKFERDVLKQGLSPKVFEAFDVSNKRVEEASRLASESGYDCLKYFVRDINYINLPSNHYDMVLANDNLHHFHNFERVFWEVSRSLKEKGVFVIYDWFGASRMQFSDKQIALIDQFVKLIPKEFRIHEHDGMQYLKNSFARPKLEAMINVDYTEGIRSGEIAGLLADHFEIMEKRDCGGSILPHVFLLIENNFKPDNLQHVGLVHKLIKLEEEVLESGEIESDYRIYICKKKEQ